MHNHILICWSLSGTQTAAVKTSENPPCQIVPVTDDPLMGSNTTPPPMSVNKPGQDAHQKIPDLAPTATKPRQDAHLSPLQPNVLYLPVMPYYILPHNPASGDLHVYGQGADKARLAQRGGQVLPHRQTGFLPAAQWFLDLQRDKQHTVGRFHQSRGIFRNPRDQRGPLLGQRVDFVASETSSEEDGDWRQHAAGATKSEDWFKSFLRARVTIVTV